MTIFFLSLVSTNARDQEATVLTACILAERGSDALFYNYDRSAAAVDLAVQYANEAILAERNLFLQKYDVNIGSTCSARSTIGSFALGLKDRGINCDVFIGPGTVQHVLI